MDKWYIAGPFFNPAQLGLIMAIEDAFNWHGVPSFSPRLHSANTKKGDLTDADARDIFGSNVNNILECRCMIAVLDWKNKKGFDVRLGQWEPDETFTVQSPPLNIPDPGTVFEMGAKYMEWLLLHRMANSRYPEVGGKPPLVMFTERPATDKVNLMLTQAGCGVIRGLDELNDFLNQGDIRWDLARPWSKHQ